MPEDDLYKEWASGVSLANPSNEYFQEIPLELNKPAEFVVALEQVPDNPTEPIVPDPVQVAPAPVEPEKNTETRAGKRGGTITLEKTSRGWKAELDSGETSIPTENFYAANKDDLIFSVLEAKLEASKLIRKLKKEKLLGGEDREHPAAPPVMQAPIVPSTALSADDVVEIRNKMQDNPGEAFDIYIKKRFGKDPEQFAAALNVADEAKSLVTAQTVKADIEEVNVEFIRENPDFYSVPENVHKLIARMAKAYLNRRIKDHAPQAVVDNTIYDLYVKGHWTVENLETAKEELTEIGELLKATTVSEVPTPQPQPAAQPGPSVPAATRIATQTGQPVTLGIPARENTPAAVPDDKVLTDVDLQKLPLNDLRKIAEAQVAAMKAQK